MYNLERVQNEFFAIAESQGIKNRVPITINSRLTRTLGRVMGEYCGDRYVVTRVEFSKQFLETSTDESIYSVIQHEAAHFIVSFQTWEHHGHDKVFKECCKKIGCTNDKTKTVVERTVEASQLYKYTIFCDTCGKEVCHYSRMNRTLKVLSQCTCRICGTSNLRMIQNW